MENDRLRRREYEAKLGLRPGFTMPNPGIGMSWLISMCIALLKVVMPAITPMLRKFLEDALLDYYKKALETENPWDDFLGRFLLRILDIPVPTE